MKTVGICLNKLQDFPSTCWAESISNQVQWVLGHNMLTPWTYDVCCGCLHGCDPGRYPTQWQCNTLLLVCLPWWCHESWQWSPVWWLWLAFSYGGSSSRLSLPHLNSASHFLTMLYEGAFYASVTTMSSWISLGVKPLRLKYRMTV